MRRTVFEQDTLQIVPEGGMAAACLDIDAAHELVNLSQRMGARFVAWDGPRSLRFQQFVGVVRTGALELEILPKLDGLPEPANLRRSLVAMLARTQRLELKESEMVGFEETAAPFSCGLARLYCRRLLDAVRGGLRQEYVLHEERLPFVRGKVDWPRHARQQTSGSTDLACIFDDRSADTPLNRTLKAATAIAGKLLEGTSASRGVTELRHALDGVADRCPPADERARLKTDRMNRNLEPLLALARLLLGHCNPDLGRSADGNQRSFALVWDMNTLFEEYIGQIAREELTARGFHVDLCGVASWRYLAHESEVRRNVFRLKPDILVSRGKRPCLVGDTKWKRLEPHTADLGVSSADVYQLLAYAHRYETEQAVLLYPYHPALGRPGLQREFVVPGTGSAAVRLRVIALDLSRPEDVPEQVAQDLGPSRLGDLTA